VAVPTGGAIKGKNNNKNNNKKKEKRGESPHLFFKI
jgi:hypothetical protein